MPHLLFIIFMFIFGACVGSFLNVVVWRLPRGESLVTPPSHCPKCNTRLSWRDNIPVFGWIFLRGKCRYCKALISARYPIIEAITGGLFVLYYVMYFMAWGPHGAGIFTNDLRPFWAPGHFWILHPLPYNIVQDWPVYVISVVLVSALLAASLIDAELFIIPLEIPWLLAVLAIPFHAICGATAAPYSVRCDTPASGALAAGAAMGLLVSILLWWRRIIPMSFPQGEPLLEIDRAHLLEDIARAKREGRKLRDEEMAVPPPYTPGQIRGEMLKEMLFLLPPLMLGLVWVAVTQHIPAMERWWMEIFHAHWVKAMLGSILGALIGGFVVWITRILGTLGFGRVAMGLGDVHLMCGVGAVIGAGAVTISFFLAPFFGILIAFYMLLTGKKRELPYGPYLSVATGVVILCYRPIADHLGPGLTAVIHAICSL